MDNRSIFRKFTDWLTAGGMMKCIGRTITLIAIIAALVITGVGVVNMYQDAEADRVVAYDKAYTKQQSKEYKALKKENDKAIKEGLEPPHDLPENVEDYQVVELPVVKLSLDDHVGPFITKYIVWAVVVLAAGIFLGWVVSNVADWIKAMIAAGFVRVIAGVFLWAGLVIAAVLVIMGLVRILQINKSTLPEVGKILMEGYVFWAVIAAGVGYALQWMILKAHSTQQRAFEGVGGKLRLWGRALFYLTLVAFAALVITALCLATLTQWMNVLWTAIAAVAVLACGWCGSLILEALGTCTMIMEPQVKEAEARAHALRHADTWVCPSCGNIVARHMATCEQCGEAKPVHE